jgi:hypothetical protein
LELFRLERGPGKEGHRFEGEQTVIDPHEFARKQFELTAELGEHIFAAVLAWPMVWPAV